MELKVLSKISGTLKVLKSSFVGFVVAIIIFGISSKLHSSSNQGLLHNPWSLEHIRLLISDTHTHTPGLICPHALRE